ncbi:hypothetical protein TWF481_011262 [Arthrobotrys musiformis]|uniref:F-box domain-containing protein n=1 Tax=Arthrobotrys musiformis TaxID=47236 RepID=A0AAV9W3V2_9PEZI
MAMASLTTLPTELLTQILTDQTLSHGDINDCALTCRLFYTIATTTSPFKRKTKYTFHVDHRSNPSWNLISCILSNPSVGHRIHRIILTWHRRSPHKPSVSWPKQWLWKSHQLVQIKNICKKYNLDEELYSVIEDGYNSEALLPLLLCLTPNLESLDLGHISPSVIRGNSSTPDSAVRIFNACDRTTISKNFKAKNIKGNKKRYFDSRWGSIYRRDILWFYTTLAPKNISLPVFQNIKHLRHGPRDPRRRKLPGWPAEHIPTILLLLPNLESAEFNSAAAFDPSKPGGEYKPLPNPSETIGRNKSSIKHLKLTSCDISIEDYCTLANLTSSLESFACTVIRTGWDTRALRERISKVFMGNNPKLVMNPTSIGVASLMTMGHGFGYHRAPDAYLPFLEADAEEDAEENLKTFEAQKAGREYAESRIWKDEESEPEGEPEYDYEHEHWCDSDCYCGYPRFEDSDSGGYWTDMEPDGGVPLRTRDVKGSKSRSHFVT